MPNSAFRTRLTSVYGSQTSSVVLSTHNSMLSARMSRPYGFQPSPVVCACKTETLGLELKVSVGPKPHLWFLYVKQRLLDRNNKSLWIPDRPVILCMHNSVLSIRITSVYGSQPSSVVFACKTASFGTELLVSMGPRPYLWFCACKTVTLGPDIQVCMVPDLICCFEHK